MAFGLKFIPFFWVCRLILRSCFKIKIKQSAGVHLGRMSVHQTKSASARELHWCTIESTWGWTQDESRINLWIQKDKLNKILQSFSGKSLDDRVPRSEHHARRSCSPGARLCCHRYFMLFPWTNKLAGSTNDDGQGRHEELLPWIGGISSYSSMVRIFLSSEHATSHDLMKKTLLLLPWDLDGSFTKSMAPNASAPVLGKIWVLMCFVLNPKLILSNHGPKNFNPRNTQLHKKQKPWMDSKRCWRGAIITQKTKTMNGFKKVLKRCNFEWESYVPSWCFDGFNTKEPHVHLCVEHPTHDGIRLTGRKKIPWAADTLSFEKSTWFYVLFLNDGF